MDMPGTALSLSSLVFGALQGQVGSLMHKWLDYKFKVKSLKCDTYLKDRANARSITSSRFQITRRAVVLMVSVTFCALHILPAYTGIPFFLFSTDSNGFVFWPFYGSTSIQIIQVRGFVLTPELCYFMGLAMGLYCGKNDG